MEQVEWDFNCTTQLIVDEQFKQLWCDFNDAGLSFLPALGGIGTAQPYLPEMSQPVVETTRCQYGFPYNLEGICAVYFRISSYSGLTADA